MVMYNLKITLQSTKWSATRSQPEGNGQKVRREKGNVWPDIKANWETRNL